MTSVNKNGNFQSLQNSTVYQIVMVWSGVIFVRKTSSPDQLPFEKIPCLSCFGKTTVFNEILIIEDE